MSTHARLLHLAVVLSAAVIGCETTPRASNDATRLSDLSVLMPTRIEIVEAFTRVKSFDDDDIPDGIELLLRAVNSLDDPGPYAVGDLQVELYEYVPASAISEGGLLQSWQVDLTGGEKQRAHWNQLTRMYEFRLGVDQERVPGKGKYLLVVTYNSPFGEHLTDECGIEYRTISAPLGGTPGRVP